MNAKLNYRNLQEFIQAIDEAGVLRRITTVVDPHLEPPPVRTADGIFSFATGTDLPGSFPMSL